MRKLLSFLLILALFLCMTGCSKGYSGGQHYHMIYDNVYEANKTFTKEGQKETLLQWGEYSYCSYLLLFPRKTPEYLKEFEYHWRQSIDYDPYSIYFSYRLDAAQYQAFKEGLNRFTLSYNGQVNQPVYSADLFEYPAYIFSWSEDITDYGFCEYILLDDAEHTVINVYMLCNSLERVQEKVGCRILPKNNDYAAVKQLLGDRRIHFAKDDGYCVYAFEDDQGSLFVPALEDLDYSIDFMPNP